MYFIPIQSEKTSASAIPDGENARSAERSSERFDVLLTESMSTGEDRRVPASAGSVESGAEAVGRSGTSQMQVIDPDTLDEASRKKIQALLEHIFRLLQNDADGEQLLKKLQEGNLYLLIPVDVQDPRNGLQGRAFLAVHRGTGQSTQSGSPVLAFSDLNQYIGTADNQNQSLSLNVSMFINVAGKYTTRDLRTYFGFNNGRSAGTFQLVDGQMKFIQAASTHEKIPMALVEPPEKSIVSDSVPHDQSANQRTRNFTIRNMHLLTPEKTNENASVPSLLRGNGVSSTINGIRDQGIAAEIAALLESLHGKLRLGRDQNSTSTTGLHQNRHLGAQQHADILQQVSHSQTHQKITKISDSITQGAGQRSSPSEDGILQGIWGQRRNATTNHEAGQAGGKSSYPRRQHPANMSLRSPGQSAGDQILQSAIRQTGETYFKNEFGQLIGVESMSLGETGPGSAGGSSSVTHTRPGILQIIQKIESMVQAAKSHRSLTQPQVMKAHLRLEPKHLGSLHMNLRFHHDTITGTILASTKDAKALIEQSLPALKDALSAQNTALQDLEVEVARDFAQDQFADSLLQEFSEQGERTSDNETVFDEAPPEEPLSEGEHSSIQAEKTGTVPSALHGWYA